MKFLYSLGVKTYNLAIKLASLSNSKAKLWVKGRKNWKSNLPKDLEGSYWFHCASVGEFEQARPLIEAIKNTEPECKIIVSFFSPSGYEFRKNYNLAHWVGYLPIDSTENAKIWLENFKPKKVFFIKYELWYYFLDSIYKNNIPLYLISANVRKPNSLLKKHNFECYNFFSHIFVQNSESLKNLINLGISKDKITISGDTRFDRVYQNAQTEFVNLKIEDFISKRKCIIAGSSWPIDDKLLIELISNFSKETHCLILVPHEMHPKYFESLKNKMNHCCLYTDEIKIEHSILIVNTIGMLSSLYKYADYCYIGGGFGKGIHNTLEAVVWGKPVFFGPKYHKFHEAIELINNEIATEVKDVETFKLKIKQWEENPSSYESVCCKAVSYIKSNLGATQKIILKIF